MKIEANKKMILTGDLHSQEGIYLNICLEYLDYLDDYAKQHEIKTIVILGDLLNKADKVKSDVFIPIFNRFERFKDDGYEIIVILGNHDVFSLLSNRSLLETFRRFCTVISEPEEIIVDGKIINLVPYTKDQAEIPTVNADYMFTHLSISDFDLGNGMIANSEKVQAFKIDLFSNYEKVFTGHFHKRQEIKNIQYVGSPYQLSFGETGDMNKGFVVFEPATGNEEFVLYKEAPKHLEISYDILKQGIEANKITRKMLENSFLKIKIDKKVEGFSNLKIRLFEEFGVISISPDFISKSGIEATDSKVKIEINSSIYDMVKDFIKSKDFQYFGEKMEQESLIEILEGIKNEV